MQKILDKSLRVFIAICIFVSPLFFFTDFTRNPYAVQEFMVIVSSFAAFFLIVLQFYKQKEHYLSFSKADIAYIIFLVVAMISLAINIFTSQTPIALLNEFWRRGHILITGLFCGYFFMRFIFNSNLGQENKESFPQQDNYKTGILLFVWALFWLPFGYFRSNGIFDIYGLIMWAAGIYIVLRYLKEITAKNILDIILSVSALACAYGICQNLNLDFLWNINIGKEFGSRSVSTFGNPNFLAPYVLLALPLAAVYFMTAKTKLSKGYYLFICILYSAFLAISQTRSSWLGLICAGLVLILSKTFRDLIFKNKKSFAILAIACLSFFFLWPSHQGKGYKSIVLQRTGEESVIKPGQFTLAVNKGNLNQSYHQRLLMWACGLENIKQKPLLGWGWGSWQLTFGLVQGKMLRKYPVMRDMLTQANSAHNIILETAAQSGIIGLLAFMVFLFFIWDGLRRYCKEETLEYKKLFYIAVFASCVAFLADSMLNITFQVPLHCFVFYLNLGILASLKVKKVSVEKSKIALFLMIIFILFIFLSVKSFNNLLSAHYSFEGYKAKSRGNLMMSKKLFEKSYNLSLDDAFAISTYTKVLMDTKDYKKLNAVVSECLFTFPYYYEFYALASGLEADKDNLEGAMVYVKKALDMYPFHKKSFDLILGLVSQHQSLRTLENADYMEELLLPLSYQNAFNVLRAQIYFEHGHYEKAREILLSELTKNQFDEQVQEKLEQVNKELNIKEDSFLQEAKKLTALRKSINSSEKVSPDLFAKIEKAAKGQNLEARMLLAQAYFKNKDYEKSRKILAELYQNNSDFMPLNFAFASLEEASGNKEEAKKYLNAILVKDNTNQLASERLKALN